MSAGAQGVRPVDSFERQDALALADSAISQKLVALGSARKLDESRGVRRQSRVGGSSAALGDGPLLCPPHFHRPDSMSTTRAPWSFSCAPAAVHDAGGQARQPQPCLGAPCSCGRHAAHPPGPGSLVKAALLHRQRLWRRRGAAVAACRRHCAAARGRSACRCLTCSLPRAAARQRRRRHRQRRAGCVAVLCTAASAWRLERHQGLKGLLR